ncbi:sulfite exporter TauE/SafE family protein [Aliiglaciecola sp. LCG003]|uniref:sulfite exporter TauE/SafE family protein n=1 Tax=Aliiglaciecola sp. LCG003 TaxID=3053655 RepID=UPI002572BB32|nr:sulfite exporter TauE/SafE family protein [Aliiglaciecola sp. LCG003]WJG09025.1 sulfite exporter TauE/SafE family protein [Aliiglaciecola sp. LCG003]
MFEPSTFFIIYLALGLVVGLLAGLLGIGGGLIIVPALLYIFVEHLGMSLATAMPMAIATSLSTIVLTGFSSAYAHFKLGHIQPPIVIWTALGIAGGALIGPLIATSIAAQQLKMIFAILVFAIAAQMIFMHPKTSDKQISKPTLLVIGFVTGIVSAFMGIGGGALMVPALVWYRINIKHAIGCAAFCGLVIAVFGSASFVVAGWSLHGLPQGAVGYVYLPAAIGIVITSVFTARVGAKISHRLDTQKLKQIFAGFLILVSLRMLLG